MLLLRPALLALVTLFPVATWSADRKTVRLEYQLAAKGAQCATETELRALVAARLGYDPFLTDAPLTAKVSVSDRGSRLLGAVELFDQAGQTIGSREVDAASSACGALSETLALALAIAIDPQLLARTPPALPSNESKPEGPPLPSPPVIERPPLAAPSPLAPTGSTTSWSASLGPLVAVGLLPQVALGFSLEGRMRTGNLSLALEGTLFPASLLEAAGGVVDSSLLRAGIRGCGHLGLVGLCARATGGVLRASGEGFERDRRGTLPTATLGPALFIEGRPFSRVLARAGVGADVALIRNSIFVGATEVWHAPPVAVEAGVAVGWSSP